MGPEWIEREIARADAQGDIDMTKAPMCHVTGQGDMMTVTDINTWDAMMAASHGDMPRYADLRDGALMELPPHWRPSWWGVLLGTLCGWATILLAVVFAAALFARMV